MSSYGRRGGGREKRIGVLTTATTQAYGGRNLTERR